MLSRLMPQGRASNRRKAFRMSGLGRLKQVAKRFIHLKRCGLGLRAPVMASASRWRLGREPRFIDMNVRNHGFSVGLSQLSGAGSLRPTQILTGDCAPRQRPAVKVSPPNRRGIRRRTGQRELCGPRSEIGTERRGCAANWLHAAHRPASAE